MMWQTLASWTTNSWFVRRIEALARRLVQVCGGCWLASVLSQQWDDCAPAYAGSSLRNRVGLLMSRLLNWCIPAHWLETSWLLGRWPNWLASDLTWLLANSWLHRIWVGCGRLLFGDDWDGPDTGSVAAPPLWRWFVYALVLITIGLMIWLSPLGMTAAKLLLVGTLLLLLWARPQWSVYVIAAVFPFLPVLSTTYLILWAFIASWLQGRLPRFSSLLLLLAAMLILLLFLAALNSAYVLASLRYLRYYLAGIALIILMLSHLPTAGSVRRLVGSILLVGGVISVWGILQYLVGAATNISWVDIRFSSITTRVVGPFDNPNMFAGYLVALLPFPLARMIQKETPWRERFANTVIAGLLGLALVLTFSRGAWLAAVAAALVLAVFLQPRLFWAIPPLLLAAPLVLPPVIWQRLASIINLEDTSNMVRLYIWNSSLQMWLRNFWSGIGLGLAPFAAVYQVYQYGAVPALHAHNLFLQVAVEGGVTAVVAFLLFNAGLWRAAISRWKLTPGLAIATAASLVGHLAHGLFDYAWYDLRLLIAFWLIAGLIMVSYRQRAQLTLPEGRDK